MKTNTQLFFKSFWYSSHNSTLESIEMPYSIFYLYWSQCCLETWNLIWLTLRKLDWKNLWGNILQHWFSTDSTKINRPEHNIRLYWTNFRQPTAHVQQNIFGKTPIDLCSPHFYASFGTFYVQNGFLWHLSSKNW